MVERLVLLRTIDSLWVEHLTELDDMRRGIGLRGYAQQDPLNEFKKEAFSLYDQLRALIRHQVATTIFRVQVVKQPAAPTPDESQLRREPRRRRHRRWPGAAPGPGVRERRRRLDDRQPDAAARARRGGWPDRRRAAAIGRRLRAASWPAACPPDRRSGAMQQQVGDRAAVPAQGAGRPGAKLGAQRPLPLRLAASSTRSATAAEQRGPRAVRAGHPCRRRPKLPLGHFEVPPPILRLDAAHARGERTR